MKKTIATAIVMLLLSTSAGLACTNFLVGKKASVDGSTMVTYSADSWYLFGALYHRAAATYPAGTMMPVYEWDTGKYLGEIEQAAEVYNVVGNMNEYQLTIGETTFGGRDELVDTTGIIDYGSLIYITLQRSKNAREAIYNIVNLVNKYGYYSSGESFSIADPDEVWIMELIGKGPGSKGFVWVARRIPDDCISAHANQARITTFPLESKKDKSTVSSKNLKKLLTNPEITTAYAADVITFARSKGWFNGKDEEFSFSDTYNPLDFTGVRCCEGRVWAFFNRCSPAQMAQYASYIRCETKERMPLWIKPDRQLSVQDMRNAMRDHYEGTEFDMSTSMGCGTQNSVYRATPLTYKYEGQEYFHERPTGTQQTGFTFVAQMRAWMPRQVGGVFWFGLDDATCNVYVPIYCSTTLVPECMDEKVANMLKFNWKSMFWVNNVVANMAYYRYNDMMPDIRNVQSEVERDFEAALRAADKHALRLVEENQIDKLINFANQFAYTNASRALDRYQELAQFLMVKFVDGCVKAQDVKGRFLDNGNGTNIPATVIKPGYSDDYKRDVLINPNPERYRVKSQAEMDNRK